ncbi:MAG: hypothetical protein ACI4WX_10140 [Aristaeellaceae bacterium]
MTEYPINLQLFADGGAGAGDAGANGAGTSGVTQQAAAADPGAIPQAAAAKRRMGKRNPLENVRFGVQEPNEQPQQAAQAVTEAQKPEDDAESWQQLKTGKYKQQFDQDVQTILKGRLKGAEENQKQMDKLTPMLAEMAKRMGKDPGDIDGIVAQYMDDDSLYEDESIRTGTPIAVLKQLKQLERQRNDAQEQVSRFALEEQNRRHIMGLIQQGEALKKVYPSFDLQKEMQNERFVAMTAPNGGCSVEEAYFALHHREIANDAMHFAADKAKQQAAQTIQANMARPAENGLGNAAPAVDIRSDPSRLTKQELKEIARRVHAGDRSIRF